MKLLDPYAVPLAGVHLIEASAGTGKTHAITTLYLRAIVEVGLLPEQLLVVTFTRAATGELRERIRARLRAAQVALEWLGRGGASQITDLESSAYLVGIGSLERSRHRLERALLVIDQAAVMTIHGFCARVLEQNAFEGQMPFGTELVESLDSMLDEIVNDFVVTRLATLDELELLAMRSIDLGAEQLRALGQFVLTHDDCELEPSPSLEEFSLVALVEQLCTQRQRAQQWLQHEPHVRALAALNKTKPLGTMGKRLAATVAKIQLWLEEPFHRLSGSCPAFSRLYELAEKYPASKTPELLAWFGMLRACDASYVELKRCMLLVGVALRREFIGYLRREIETRKASQDVQTYDDLLRRLRDALVHAGGAALASSLRERFPLALIDEFQDTDPVQYEVFSRIYQRDASLFLIGDPKQSIYAFRGADVDNYLKAKRDERVHCHTLGVNWRSDPSLLAGLDELYSTHQDPFMGAGIDFVAVSPRPAASDTVDERGRAISGVHLLWVEPAAGESDKGAPKFRARRAAMNATVAQIRQLLGTQPRGWTRPLCASDIAVLGRTNRECQALSRVLFAHGIRCVQTSDSSVLSSDAAGALVILLRALLLPNDSRRVSAWLVDEMAGLLPVELELVRAGTDDWERWIERLVGQRRVWERSGLLAVVVRLCDMLELKLRVLRKASGERFLTDLFHVAELVQTVAKQQRLSLDGQLAWLERARQGDADCSLEDQQLRIEADSQAVLLTTVHRSKGLQFAFVICPFLWDGGGQRRTTLLSYRRSAPEGPQAARVLHLEPRLLDDDDPAWQAFRVEQLRENARLLYVALTRAKHQVAVVWTKATGFSSSALYHLLFAARAEAAAATVLQPNRALLAQLRHVETLALLDAEPLNAGLDAAPEFESPPSVEPNVGLVQPQELRRVVVAAVQTTSYSALTAVSSVHADVGRDVDALPGVRPGSELLLANVTSAALTAAPPAAVELPLLSLPPGTRTGEALHAILELADFQRYAVEGSEPDVVAVLDRFGLDGRALECAVRRGIGAILQVELRRGDPQLKLCNIASTARKSEFEFLMKVDALSVDRLVAATGTELTGLDADYRHELARLRFDPVSGYLRGFIDLVFEHDERFYVVDYKSNALGGAAESFAAERLAEEMRRHHYPVQAAIYASALDTWLRTAKAGYDYEAHFGGVLYLFIRGMATELEPGHGVYFHRPSARSLQQFETMLRGGTN